MLINFFVYHSIIKYHNIHQKNVQGYSDFITIVLKNENINIQNKSSNQT